MRITRETLLKLANEHAEKRARANRDIVCIYLSGALLSDAPLLGGSADIDLICVHASEPPFPREVQRLTDDISLDVAHYSQNLFRQPRRLRNDAWLGGYLVENPLALYDTQHWFEFTQASAAASFYEPETIIQRVRPMAEAARQAWFDLQESQPESSPANVLRSLWIMEKAANCVACLSGPPLTERRFLLQYPARTEAIGRPGLSAGLVDLTMPAQPSDKDFEDWLKSWAEVTMAAAQQPGAPVKLAAFRRHYYERAMGVLWAEVPPAALWLLLRTWTLAINSVNDPQYLPAWQSAVGTLGFGSPDFADLTERMDTYLDAVEETLDDWAGRYGVS